MDNNYPREENLIDTIRKISKHVNFTGSKRDSAHSQFLLDMIEDMEGQIDSIRQNRVLSSHV